MGRISENIECDGAEVGSEGAVGPCGVGEGAGGDVSGGWGQISRSGPWPGEDFGLNSEGLRSRDTVSLRIRPRRVMLPADCERQTQKAGAC